MTDMLSRRLDAFMEGLLDRVEPAVARVLVDAARAAEASGVLDAALRRGDRAPDFVLPDQDGRPVSLRALRARGPVVLTFFRGGWCPFCALTLRAMDEAAPELAAAGATLIAISPQNAEAAARTAARGRLRFPVLTDQGNAVARRYGLVWQLGPELRAVYEKLGHWLPKVNGTGDWTLPIPAGYVIASDGVITHDHLDTRITRRLEPLAALQAVRALHPGDRAHSEASRAPASVSSDAAAPPADPGP